MPIGVCGAVKVTYADAEYKITAVSQQKEMLESKRFYFVGPASHIKKSILEKESALSFYCKDSKGLHKVGIYVTKAMWQKGGIPKHTLHIITANIKSTNAYLVPAVRCGTEQALRGFGEDLKTSPTVKHRLRPKVYASTGVKAKLREYESTIPCANNTRKLFKYIEAYL